MESSSAASTTVHPSSTKYRLVNSNNPTIFADPISTTIATKKPLPSANNAYKWRRRSSSGTPLSVIHRREYLLAVTQQLKFYRKFAGYRMGGLGDFEIP